MRDLSEYVIFADNRGFIGERGFSDGSFGIFGSVGVMDILKIAGVAIISVAAVTLLRESRPTLALILAISAGLVIVLMILDSLFEVIATFHGLADEFFPDGRIFRSVLKIIGVGYVAEFTSSVCVDSGNKSIADKVMLAGKITVMLLTLPVIKALIGVIGDMLP